MAEIAAQNNAGPSAAENNASPSAAENQQAEEVPKCEPCLARIPAGLGLSEISAAGKGSYGLALVILIFLEIYGAARGSGALCLYALALFLLLFVGDFLYSRFLANYIFRLSDDEVTPPQDPKFAGNVDYVATPAFVLFGHHWTSITGAAPIIGPAIACYYGWLPAILWVVFGGIFAGSVHDFSVLVLSARNEGRSIADLAGLVIHWRARVVFLLLIMFLCWIVIAVFMNAIANLFMGNPETVMPVNAEIPLAALMGLASRLAYKKLEAKKAKTVVAVLSVVMLVVLYGLVFAGVKIEEEGGKWVGGKNVDPVFGWALHEWAVDSEGARYTIERQICRDSVNYRRQNGVAAEPTCGFGAKQFWTIYLTLYGFIVSVVPVWLVLQPRDFINSHQLKFCMFLLVLGLLVAAPSIDAEAVRSDVDQNAAESTPIFPMLFTTIACGAVSGFHGLVSSGVTSKQVEKMRDVRPVGYGGMLGESALAALVVTVCCSSGAWSTNYPAWPVSWGGAFIPAAAALIEELGVDARQARAIIIVLVVSFAATTMDSAMRIQRVLVAELGGLFEERVPPLARLLKNVLFAGLISAVPACLLANSRIVSSLWNLFGATNQLVACLSLITVTIYVWRYHGFQWKYTIPFLLPVLFLTFFITWALIRTIVDYMDLALDERVVVDWISTVPTYPSLIMAYIIAFFVFWMMFEAVWYLLSRKYKEDAPVSWETGRIGELSKAQGGGKLEGLRCC